MYSNDMDSLYRRRMAFRYSIFMLVVGMHVCAYASVCVGERAGNMLMESSQMRGRMRECLPSVGGEFPE